MKLSESSATFMNVGSRVICVSRITGTSNVERQTIRGNLACRRAVAMSGEIQRFKRYPSHKDSNAE
jgi:hypothetical protein